MNKNPFATGLHQRDQPGGEPDPADGRALRPQLSHLQGHQRKPGNGPINIKIVMQKLYHNIGS
jgi:hypothetical protein